MAQQPFEQALKDEGLVGTPLESLARSIYMQESGGGKNTKTSNAGAVGGMQILPGTFKEVMPEGDINNPYDNARAGLRYIKKMYDTSGGDLNLTAVGYYGGPGGIQKAKQGVAVRDPRNPNAPDTLEYAKQVLARTDVPRGTNPPKIIRKNIENLGTGYQAAFALMSAADEEPENEREKAAREAQEETESAQQFAAIQKQLTSTQLRSPFPQEEPVRMANGGMAIGTDQTPFQPTVPGNLNQSVVMMNNGGQVSIEKRIADKIGLGPAYDASVQAPKDMGMSGDEGTQGDAVRHMVLMREVEKKYGPTAARLLGYGHEFGMGMFRGQSSRDREMDLDNNALGLQLSKQAGSDDDKFRELMRQSLSDKRATYYRDEYKKPVRRAEGSPEEGETSRSAKDMLKEVGRSTQYAPYDLLGAPVDVINLGLKGVDYVAGTKLATEKPVGGSDWLIEKARQMGLADKPTGSMTETLTRLGTGMITPGGAVKAAEIAKRPVSAARKMLDDVKARSVADEIDPAVLKEVQEAKTGPRPVVRTPILPTPERPFVGQLERIAADMNPSTVEQFRNMVAKSGRDYEIERLDRALEGLGPKDKITSKIMLERLEKTLPPSKYKTQLIEPDAPEKGFVDFHQAQDNPYPSKRMGTVNLLLDKTPEEAMQASYFGNLEKAISNIKNTDPVEPLSGKPIDYAKAEKDIEMFLTMPEFKGTPLGQMFKQDLPEITRLRKEAGLMETLTNTYLYPITRAKAPYREAYPELKDIPDWEKEASTLMKNSREKNVSLRMDTAQEQANEMIRQKVLDKVNELYGVDLRPQLNTPEMQALDETARNQAASNIFARTFASDYLGKSSELNEILSKYKTPAFEQIVQNKPYAGTHTSIANDNPISFSRFVDLELPDNRKGMLVTELQSDRFKAVKEGKAPEAYPGMEKSPQVIQQLMIKNAVYGGIKRDTDIVLFPGADSNQAQLYEKLPNNIRAVLKDLGPGFKMEKIAVPNEKGDIIERYGITWDKKAAERVTREGVRFNQGGLVEKN